MHALRTFESLKLAFTVCVLRNYPTVHRKMGVLKQCKAAFKTLFSWFDALLLYPISKLPFDSLKKKMQEGKKAKHPLILLQWLQATIIESLQNDISILQTQYCIKRFDIFAVHVYTCAAAKVSCLSSKQLDEKLSEESQ